MKISIAIFVILTALYAEFLSYWPKPSKIMTQSFWQDNQQIVEGYFRTEMKAPVIIVGSSMAHRLTFPGSACVFNLGLEGGAALTGLDAILRSPHQPRIVFVEINVPDRSSDLDIVKKSDNFFKRLSPLFYTENMPANRLYSFMRQHAGKTSEAVLGENEFNSISNLQRQVYDHDIEQGLLASQISLFQDKIKAIEKRGIRIVLFEMPVAAALEQMPKAVQIRTAFLKAFPDNLLIRYAALSMNANIHSADGIHLSENEAAAVVEKLSPYYASVCGKP